MPTMFSLMLLSSTPSCSCLQFFCCFHSCFHSCCCHSCCCCCQQAWLAGELIIRAESLGLTSLPHQLLLKSTVRKLILTGNQLDSLPVELFQQLRELRELRLGHNRLTYLPEEVQCLQQLHTLDLQHNQLKLVPASLFKCVHLKVLNLNSNPLCSWLRELWPQPPAQQPQGQEAAGSSGAHESAAEHQQLKANTRALLDHLLHAQVGAYMHIMQQGMVVCFLLALYMHVHAMAHRIGSMGHIVCALQPIS